jgi:hypothetical protein
MTNADERIDQILRGLNAAEVPARLEQRVIAKVAQRTAEVSDTRFVGWQALVARFSPYAVGAAVAVVLCTAYVGWVSHRAPGAVEQGHLRTDSGASAPRVSESATPVNARRGVKARSAQRAEMDVATAPMAVADDPDAVALAETLAPSHPAPPMPATPQELVAMRSGRAGNSVEMAELHGPHEPGFRTERERTAVRQYILGLLDPLVTAQNLTSSPPPAEDPPAPTSAPDTISTN